jgi:hypothetical protein
MVCTDKRTLVAASLAGALAVASAYAQKAPAGAQTTTD